MDHACAIFLESTGYKDFSDGVLKCHRWNCEVGWVVHFGELFTLGLIHFARYMRLTKGDKVKHMFGSLGAIHFGELFTLGLIHFVRYMRLTKGDKVKHIFCIGMVISILTSLYSVLSKNILHAWSICDQSLSGENQPLGGGGYMPIVYQSRQVARNLRKTTCQNMRDTCTWHVIAWEIPAPHMS